MEIFINVVLVCVIERTTLDADDNDFDSCYDNIDGEELLVMILAPSSLTSKSEFETKT